MLQRVAVRVAVDDVRDQVVKADRLLCHPSTID